MSTHPERAPDGQPGEGAQDRPGGQPDDRRAAGEPVSVEDERSADDRDEGWGDRTAGFDDDWYLEQRPPHWE